MNNKAPHHDPLATHIRSPSSQTWLKRHTLTVNKWQHAESDRASHHLRDDSLFFGFVLATIIDLRLCLLAHIVPNTNEIPTNESLNR